jgi:hypothetical protein
MANPPFLRDLSAVLPPGNPSLLARTGTQLGAVVGVTLNIYDFSTPADKQVLVQAFEKVRTKAWPPRFPE